MAEKGNAPFFRAGQYGGIVSDDPEHGWGDAEDIAAYGGQMVCESVASAALRRAIMAVLPAIEVCRGLAPLQWCAPTADLAGLAALAQRVVNCADTGRPGGQLLLTGAVGDGRFLRGERWPGCVLYSDDSEWSGAPDLSAGLPVELL